MTKISKKKKISENTHKVGVHSPYKYYDIPLTCVETVKNCIASCQPTVSTNLFVC